MLTIEWANRGINLWTIEQGQIVMNTGQPIYPFPADTIDLLDQVIRTQANGINQTDINITRISESTYSTIPNKLTQGRPIQVWVNRQTANTNATTMICIFVIEVNLYPLPIHQVNPSYTRQTSRLVYLRPMEAVFLYRR
jgi:hypothetical protein